MSRPASSGRFVCSLLALALLASPSANLLGGTEHLLSMRILDAESGKPIEGVWAVLEILHDMHGARDVLNVKTDSEGIAIFRLPDPIPERVGLTSTPDELLLCSDVQFPTVEIFKTGVVSRGRCKGAAFKYSAAPKPGELVIFGKRVSLWQRILREL
jgi:hypothetical protein